MPLDMTAIVAMADQTRAIGRDNGLPWSLPEDWHYYLRFIRTTKAPGKVNALLLGRKTFESIPKELGPSLKPCLNVVITSRGLDEEALKDKNVRAVGSFEEGVALINEQFSDRVEKIIVSGGSQVYRQGFEHPAFSRLYLTRVFGQLAPCDTFLEPEDFLARFRRLSAEELAEEGRRLQCHFNEKRTEATNGLQYVFEVYEKES